MQVYGDIERHERAGEVARDIDQRLERCRELPPGLGRHQALVAAFIRASELVQGIADGEWALTEADDLSRSQLDYARLLLTLAQAVAASWDSGFAQMPRVDQTMLGPLRTDQLIRTRQAEGYAFYALYPEAYLAAARQSKLGPDTTVIGIRSIGLGLAAMVSAAIGAPPAISVRPGGHPFDRRIRLSDTLAQRLIDSTGAFAVVDEGPGMSGSSFNCVADWLVVHGVGEERIHFFPSHGGDLGSAARPEHRERWARAQKHHVQFAELVLGASNPAHRLQTWIAEAAGPLDGPLEDLSGGRWRQAPAPADPAMERLKFRVDAGGQPWLAKYAGLGATGEHKLKLAHQLATAGFAPRPLGLCHGFIVMPWTESVPSDAPLPLRRVADYLVLRAGLAADGQGASIEQLFDMAIRNLGLLRGQAAGETVRVALGEPSRFSPRPCCTDNRMHLWEWVHTSGGWLKFDALDHHAAHDLVGCQDIAWDIAGAAVELDQPAQSLAALTGLPVDPEFLQVMELCYLAFQIGLWTMARDRNGAPERPAAEALLAAYEDRAARLLEAMRQGRHPMSSPPSAGPN